MGSPAVPVPSCGFAARTSGASTLPDGQSTVHQAAGIRPRSGGTYDKRQRLSKRDLRTSTDLDRRSWNAVEIRQYPSRVYSPDRQLSRLSTSSRIKASADYWIPRINGASSSRRNAPQPQRHDAKIFKSLDNELYATAIANHMQSGEFLLQIILSVPLKDSPLLC